MHLCLGARSRPHEGLLKRVTGCGAWEGEQERMLQTRCLCADVRLGRGHKVRCGCARVGRLMREEMENCHISRLPPRRTSSRLPAFLGTSKLGTTRHIARACVPFARPRKPNLAGHAPPTLLTLQLQIIHAQLTPPPFVASISPRLCLILCGPVLPVLLLLPVGTNLLQQHRSAASALGIRIHMLAWVCDCFLARLMVAFLSHWYQTQR